MEYTGDPITGLVLLALAVATLVGRRGFVAWLLSLYTEPDPPLPKWRLPAKPTERQLTLGVWVLVGLELLTAVSVTWSFY